jgi:hypothetical protein
VGGRGSGGEPALDKTLNSPCKTASINHIERIPDRSAVVPFDADVAVDVPLLRVFIKILGAIREDSPLVPALLTDYILKVLCPNDVAAGPRGAPIDIVSL